MISRIIIKKKRNGILIRINRKWNNIEIKLFKREKNQNRNIDWLIQLEDLFTSSTKNNDSNKLITINNKNKTINNKTKNINNKTINNKTKTIYNKTIYNKTIYNNKSN